MTPEMALRLGRAITFVAGRGKNRQVRVVIGKDTRLSGYLFETALASGICAMGGRVMLCGPVPTPAVANLTQSMRADAGGVSGIALDGDADRVIMVDERGEVVDGDAVMALCALRMLKQGKLPKKTVV